MGTQQAGVTDKSDCLSFMHHSPLPSRFHRGLSNQKWKEYVRLFCVPDDTEQSIFGIPPTHQILIPLNTQTYINLEHSYLYTIKL